MLFNSYLRIRKLPLSISVSLIFIGCLFNSGWASSSTHNKASGDYDSKVFIIELDSLRKDYLYEILDELPNISEIIRGQEKNSHFVYLPTVETIIPSASSPANTSIYTGVYPATNGIYATTWFDRCQVKIQKLISYSQDRINNILKTRRVKTIFDYVNDSDKTSFVTMLSISKGVESANWIRSSVFLWANSFWISFFKGFGTIPDAANIDKKGTRGFLKGHVYSLSDGIEGFYRKHNTIPDLMVMHYFAFDIFSHYPPRYQVKEQWSMKKIQQYYLKHVIDPQVGRIVKWLKEKELFENCIFFFIADHGMTRITKHLDDDLVRKVLTQTFKTRRFGRKLSSVDVVCLPGAGTKAIYIKNRESNEWCLPPSLISDIKPAIDLLIQVKQIRNSLTTLLINQFPGEREESISETDAFWYFDIPAYIKTQRKDEDFINVLKPLSIMDSLYPNTQLSQYFRKQYSRDTAPDILLINKPGLFFTPNKGKYAHHGSIHPSDSLVSFVIGGPRLSQKLKRSYIIEDKISVLDLMPTLGSILNLEMPLTTNGEDIFTKHNILLE